MGLYFIIVKTYLQPEIKMTSKVFYFFFGRYVFANNLKNYSKML